MPILRLGSSAPDEHQKIADLSAQLNIQKVVLLGENFIKTNSSVTKFKNFEDIARNFKDIELPTTGKILIKGSRGMALERLLDLL